MCEIQFDGFVYPAFDQIVSQVAKFRYRNEGRVAMPLTIRIPYGGGIGAVEHHSESPEAYFAHTAGLRVVTPSNAADGHRMIQQAIASDDPVVFFEPKRRYWEKGDVDDDAPCQRVPLHRAERVIEGTRRRRSSRTAPWWPRRSRPPRIGEEEGTSFEVIDLRSLSPVDFETLEASVRKTGRLVVAHEAPVFCGLGAEIAAGHRAMLLPPRVAGAAGRRLRDALPAVAGWNGTTCPTPTGSSTRSTGVSRGERRSSAFRLPDLGEGLTEAEIVAWHVAVGDEVALNQVLVEVETEKAVVELPSPFAGTVVELLAGAGRRRSRSARPIIAIAVAAEAPTLRRRSRREKVPTLVGYGPTETPPSRRRRKRRSATGAPPPGTAPAPPRRAARWPRRRCASWPARTGSTWPCVAGHGPGGSSPAMTWPPTSPACRGPLRTASAPGVPGRRSVASRSTWPMRWCAASPLRRRPASSSRVDVTPTVSSSGASAQNRHFEGLHVTPLAVVARAVLLALREHPALNSSWDDATAEVVTKHYVNLGIAVAGPTGLVVPNVKDAQEMTLRDLTRALARPDRPRPRRALHAGRPERRHHHRDQCRRLRGRRRRAHPEPG